MLLRHLHLCAIVARRENALHNPFTSLGVQTMHPLLLLGTLLLCPSVLLAQVTYQTSYIAPDDGRSAKATVQIVKNLPLSSNARREFFSESLKNTSLTESELVEKMRSGDVRTQPCGYECNLITARLASGTSQYWRRVQAHEPVTYVLVLWFGHESVPSDPVFFYPNQTVCCTGGTQ